MYRLYMYRLSMCSTCFFLISPGGRLAVGPVAHRGAGRSLGGSKWVPGRVSRCIVITYRFLVNNRNMITDFR